MCYIAALHINRNNNSDYFKTRIHVMNFSLGSSILLFGIALCALSQISIAIDAFTRNPLKGAFCIIVPMYIVVYARKSQTGSRLLNMWYIGIALLITGGIISS